MEKEIETVFVVAVHTDGTFSANLEQLPEPIQVKRPATTFDVFQTSQQIVKEIESQILVERIVNAVSASLLPPAEQSIPDAVKEKLAERGIQPESSATTE